MKNNGMNKFVKAILMVCLCTPWTYAEEQPRSLENSLIEFDALFDTPINFWGKVIDDNGQPIAGVNAKFYLLDKPVWSEDGSNTSKFNVISDENGNFELLNKKGASLSVIAKAKGYAPAYDEAGNKISRADVDYSNPAAISYSRIPTKDKPYVLILRKKGELADLKEIKPQKFDIPRDGSVKEVLLKGAPLIFNVRCWSSAPEPFTRDFYSWRADVRVVEGKLRPVIDEHSVIAPKEGYLEAIKIDMPESKAKGWRYSSPQGLSEFWVKLDNGTYARLRINIITGHQHAVMLSGLLNLDGNNSFEK